MPTRSSWAWRNLLSLRHLMKQLVAWRVGDGSHISFWLDSWLPNGPLIKILGKEFVKKVGSNLKAKVRDFYHSSPWISFTENRLSRKDRVKAADMQKLADYIPQPMAFQVNKQDEIIWKPTQSTTFSIKSAWQATRKQAPKVLWRALVWFKEAVPRFAFTMWLVMHDKLPTFDRLRNVGIIDSNQCPICRNEEESADHLFFGCAYSKEVWKIVMTEHSSIQPMEWTALMQVLSNAPASNLLHNSTFKKRLSALTYYIWMERNYRNFEDSCLTPSCLASMINRAIL